MKKLIQRFWDFLRIEESDPVLEIKKRRFIAVVNAPTTLIFLNVYMAGWLLVGWATGSFDTRLFLPLGILLCGANAGVLAFLILIEYRRWCREKGEVRRMERYEDAIIKDAEECLEISRQLLELEEGRPGAPRLFRKKDK